MTLDDIVKRCSEFSGYKLSWRFHKEYKTACLEISEEGKDNSRLVLCLGGEPALYEGLHESYGRLRHWAIRREEMRVMADLLKRYESEDPITQQLLSL